MNKKKTPFFCIVFTVVLGLTWIPSQAQNPVKEKVINVLNTFSTHYPQEKVYLQSDRIFYATGENIWFSAYIEYQQKPTTLSGILYVWLTDSKGKEIIEKILPIIEGKANGNIELPDSLTSGNYQIVAFTNWMLNFDPAYLFHKDIMVFHSGQKLKNNGTKADDNYSVDFFPEGGNLVSGLQSTIAFKAVEKSGLPVEISGQIIDDSGHVITGIQSTHDEMGTFSLKPVAGRKYVARIHFPDNKTQDYPIPEAQSFGIVMHVSNRQLTEHKIYILLQRNSIVGGQNDQVMIAIQSGEKLFTPEISFDKDKAGIAVPTDLLPSGIMHITVFNEEAISLAQRLTFIGNEKDVLPLKLDHSQPSNQPRTKNTFVLKGAGSGAGIFSISVTDADLIPSAKDKNNILSYLLMTSDIKGYVHHPGWYFSNLDTTHLQALDLVMMTNGWNRFTWKKILSNTFPKVKYPLERRLMLSGRILTGRHREPLKNGKVVMDFEASKDSLYKTFTFNTDDSGKFALKVFGFHDKGSFYFDKVNTPAGKHPSFEVEIENRMDSLVFPLSQNNFSKETIPGVNHFMSVATAQNDVMKKMKDKSIVLQTITIEGRRKTHLDSINTRYASPLFNSISEMSFDTQRDWGSQTSMSVLDFIRNQVPGIVVVGNSTMYWHLTTGMLKHSLTEMQRLSTPAIFINEVPVYTGGGGDLAAKAVSNLSDIKLYNVALIKVFRVGFVGSPGGSPHGAIAIYLRMGGDEAAVSHKSNAVVIHKDGYALVKEFYSPDYAKPNDNNLPDKRLTLYWNPGLRTDSTGTATFSFYNNDITHRFHITIEGMDSTGKIGRIEKIIDLDSNKK